MNGKKAKEIRTFVYGLDHSIARTRYYSSVALNKKKSNETVMCLGLRRAYQLTKKDYKAGRPLDRLGVTLAKQLEGDVRDQILKAAIAQQRAAEETQKNA